MQVKTLVEELWEDEYASSAFEDAMTTTSPSRPPPGQTFAQLHEHKRVKLRYAPIALNQYKQHCGEDLEHGINALQYWNSQYTSRKNKGLPQFALNMLAILAMSSECERVFSSAKSLLTDRRARRLPDVILILTEISG